MSRLNLIIYIKKTECIKTMPLLFITGTASKETRNTYVTALAARIPNSVYLDLNNFNIIFKELNGPDFNENYSYEQRLGHPSQEALLGLTQDNALLHKVVIIEGNFDFALVAKYIKEKFPDLTGAKTCAIELHANADFAPLSVNTDHLIKLTQNKLLRVNVLTDFEDNLTAIMTHVNLRPMPIEAKGKLVMGAGLAGVGKTTLLKYSCTKIISAIYLDKDTVAVPLLASVEQGMPSPYYDKYIKAQSYQAIFAFAADNLKLNKTTILDGCFGDRLTGSLISNHLATSPYATLLMYFHCTGPTQLERIIQRNYQRDTEKLKDIRKDRKNNIQKHLKEFSQIDPASFMLYLDTENLKCFEENARQIIQFITFTTRSLKVLPRSVPYDDKSCEITEEQAQGGLFDFIELLDKVTIKDQTAQNKAVQTIAANDSTSKMATSRYSLWQGALKLPSGKIHEWPHTNAETADNRPAEWRHLQRRN
jgi:predicted kinase